MYMKNVYKTRDLAEAAALLVTGEQLMEVEREVNVCWFVFRDKGGCRNAANQYYFGDLLVNARAYREAINRLKNMIFGR